MYEIIASERFEFIIETSYFSIKLIKMASSPSTQATGCVLGGRNGGQGCPYNTLGYAYVCFSEN
jgi:hypothetical protein